MPRVARRSLGNSPGDRAPALPRSRQTISNAEPTSKKLSAPKPKRAIEPSATPEPHRYEALDQVESHRGPGQHQPPPDPDRVGAAAVVRGRAALQRGGHAALRDATATPRPTTGPAAPSAARGHRGCAYFVPFCSPGSFARYLAGSFSNFGGHIVQQNLIVRPL